MVNLARLELCLTSMKDKLHFEDDSDSDEIKAEEHIGLDCSS